MAPHSSTLAWKIPWTEEAGGLQSMGLLRVGQDWVTTFTLHFHALEKEMATHSSVLAWRIPGTGEPDGLPSMGSHRVGHDWSDLAVAAYSCQRRRRWHPTPVLLPGKSHRWRSLVGCTPWGHEESDMTERFPFTLSFHALEKEMATHSSVLAWRIPGMGEPDGLPSMGSHRVGHDWSDLAVAAYSC